MEQSLIKKKFFEITNSYINNNKISHAYLIEIGDYDADFSYVLDFVKMILCNCPREKLKDDMSNISNLIDNGNYPDLKIIEPEGQWIKKNQLIDLMDEFQNKSLLDNKKVYIIKEAERLNSSSANTILKFLEEPEEGIVAILLTKNRFQVIETILSRCQILNLADGNLLMDISENSEILLNFIIKGEDLFINYDKIITEIISDKQQAKLVFNEISQIIIAYLNDVNGANERLMGIRSILNKCDSKKLINIISIIEEELYKLEYNVNYKLWLDSLFARFILGG